MEIQTLPTAELPPQKEKKPLLPRFVIALLALSLAGNAFQFWRGHPREQPNSGFQAGASFLPEVRYSDVVRGIGSLVHSMEASESLSCRNFALVPGLGGSLQASCMAAAQGQPAVDKTIVDLAKELQEQGL